ncbi:cytochrome c biogenesis protein ResB [Candidatus Magnetominusculus dajiuhuensis]|uniref:cytochrome c biogenesis protein ResB n=1 Tax=Candidatus Magnetominusculus dajiuhuensis TaxID=3137712 RepID=UPI003B42C950
MSDKTIIEKAWGFFTSVKLAVVLFGVIALSSIIGTVVEQNAQPEKNIKLFAKMFGQGNAQTAYKAATALGFTDMYHSWWFTAMLVCFCANLTICSIDRLPRIKRVVDEPLKPIEASDFDKYGIKKELAIEGGIEAAKTAVLTALKRLGMTPDATGTNTKDIQFYAHKGRYTRYAVYVIHFSIVIILVGAVIGVTLGFSGFLNLPEGETSAVAYSRQGDEHPLGYSVRCDNFAVRFYENSNMPKEYISWLSIIEDGKTVLKKSIGVNSPLKYKGYTFYQSSYGVVPGKDVNGQIILNITPRGGQPGQIALAVGESFSIPGTKLTGKVAAFSPDLSFDKDERPFTVSENMNNPAIFVELTEPGKEKSSGWIVKRYPKTWELPDGHKVELVDNYGYQYTGLQVRKDPGVWVVYAGCLFMAIGLYSAFFLSHKKIWVLLQPEKTKVNVKIAAFTNKNKIGYGSTIDAVFDRLAPKLSKRG